MIAEAMLPPGAAGMVLVYLRLQGCILALPGYAERSVPARLRVALAIALTPLFAAYAGFEAVSDAGFALAAAREAATGLLLGVLVRLTAMALTIAASAIASATSLAQLFGIEVDMSPHPVGNLLHLAGLALLMALGLPQFVAGYLAAGYDLLPPGALPDAAALAPHAAAVVARAFMLALVLASPFVLGGLLFQAITGVVNRVMPALPVVFVAAPAAILLALAALSLLAAPIVTLWAGEVLDTPLSPLAAEAPR